MELLASLFTFLTGYLAPFLLVIIVIIVVHEGGHFLMARWCDVDVEVFSVGFGPELWGRRDRAGTRWRIAAIPLGGYVRFRGDMEPASVITAEKGGGDPRSFASRPLRKRALVVAAGPAANFIFAILVFSAFYLVNGRTEYPPLVSQVQEGSPAQAAGIRPGDRILSIDGEKVSWFSDIRRLIIPAAGRSVDMVLVRDGQRIATRIVPDTRSAGGHGPGLATGFIGVSAYPEKKVSLPVPLAGALVLGLTDTGEILSGTLGYAGRVIGGSETGAAISGPIGIARISGDFFSHSLGALVSLMAVLSVSVGMVNLLPIPVLDGGHLMFYAIEAIRGRPVSPRTQEVGYLIGFSLLLFVFVSVSFNDILNL